MLPKLVRLHKQIPKLNKIIYFDRINKKLSADKLEDSTISLIALSYLEQTGKQSNEELTYRQMSEEDIAVLLYTSGIQLKIQL